MTTNIIVHGGLALAGYVAFMVAGISGLIYLKQERQLKMKNPAFLRRPTASLETLDRTNLWALWIGFILFTLGDVDGARLARGRVALSDPKSLWSWATWGAYAALLLVRTTAVSRGRKVAALSALCLLLVGFTFVGVNYFLGGQHVFF